MKSFASDNYAGVLPEIMEALHQANREHAVSYGGDHITERVRKKFREVFGESTEVLFVFNGTGANVLSIAGASRSFHSVLCADISHIYNDESSAPETFTGCRFFPLQTNRNGLIEPEAIERRMIRKGDVHFAQPRLVSVTQSTEYGTVYTKEHLKEIAAVCRKHELLLHMDGSRLFNAADYLRCNLREITADAGVDILSLGGTKLGMMFGEAVVIFSKKSAEYISFQQKQLMQLASKTRFISAQYEVLLDGNHWQKVAGHANAMAQLLCRSLKKFDRIRITMPVEANAVFAIFPEEWIGPLQQCFPFYVWNENTGEVRLMCSFDTTEADIYAFGQAIEKLIRS